MKVCVVGDVHWSTYSSILRSRGVRCSTRLEKLVNTINWVEETSLNMGCDVIVYLGDFFDKPELNSEEISMLKEITWNNLTHYFVVGNHESDVASLEYNSTNVFKKYGFNVISTPTTINNNMVILPYITEDNRKELKEYLKDTINPIVFSHNDIKGIRYGAYESKIGFEVSEIEEQCRLFINGHLHNGNWINKNKTILNLGNICGQNFSEDAFVYSHRIMVLNMDDCSHEFIENPHALNFYKVEIDNEMDMRALSTLKDNAVLSIKCESSLKDRVKELLDNNDKVCTYKLIIYVNSSNERIEEQFEKSEIKGIDYIEKFKEFIINNMGNDKVVIEELGEICKNI